MNRDHPLTLIVQDHRFLRPIFKEHYVCELSNHYSLELFNLLHLGQAKFSEFYDGFP